MLPEIWFPNLYVCISPRCRGRALSDPSRKVRIYNMDQKTEINELEKENDDKVKPQKGFGEDIQFLLELSY